MNWLDWVLLVLVAAYALSGYWQGFIAGATATVGLLLGGAGGVLLAPVLLGDIEPSTWVSLGALFTVILCASVGQALGQFIGSHLRAGLSWQPARALDAIGGAALSGVAVLLVSWVLGVALSGATIGPLTDSVRSSQVLGRVNSALPVGAPSLLQAFNNLVGTSVFPRYLEPFAPERIVATERPPSRILDDPEVQAAQGAVVKVRGRTSCGSGVEGTGFFYETDRVMTNAHVVAGVDEPSVEVGGQSLPATVVHFDPEIDVAVLAVDATGVRPLGFDQTARAGQGGAVLGFPEDGPYDVQPIRIRAEQRLRSPDIHGDGSVVRDVYSVRGLIRRGNSGGPMVDADGEVIGVVFAASITDGDTGYTLTAAQVMEAARAGSNAEESVDTGDCIT